MENDCKSRDSHELTSSVGAMATDAWNKARVGIMGFEDLPIPTQGLIRDMFKVGYICGCEEALDGK